MSSNFTHKYQKNIETELDGECDCPPLKSMEILQDIGAYRFVFKTCGSESFIPQAISSPDILVNKSCETKCGYFSLSMYTDPVSARRAYTHFLKYPNFAMRAGDHLAEGTLSRGDGLVTPPYKDHFELHENINPPVLLHTKFKVIAKL